MSPNWILIEPQRHIILSASLAFPIKIPPVKWIALLLNGNSDRKKCFQTKYFHTESTQTLTCIGRTNGKMEEKKTRTIQNFEINYQKILIAAINKVANRVIHKSKHYHALKVKALQMMNIWLHPYITVDNVKWTAQVTKSHNRTPQRNAKSKVNFKSNSNSQANKCSTRRIDNAKRTERSRITSINVRNYNITINRRMFTQFLSPQADWMLLNSLARQTQRKTSLHKPLAKWSQPL